MKIIDLLNKIANGEMEEAVFYVNGDFFYDLTVIDKELYVINTMTKKLEPLENKYIGRFIKDNVELLRLDNFVEILEEEKKIPEKIDEYIHTDSLNYNQCNYMFEKLTNKYNEIIDYLDYLKSKGE